MTRKIERWRNELRENASKRKPLRRKRLISLESRKKLPTSYAKRWTSSNATSSWPRLLSSRGRLLLLASARKHAYRESVRKERGPRRSSKSSENEARWECKRSVVGVHQDLMKVLHCLVVLQQQLVTTQTCP